MGLLLTFIPIETSSLNQVYEGIDFNYYWLPVAIQKSIQSHWIPSCIFHVDRKSVRGNSAIAYCVYYGNSLGPERLIGILQSCGTSICVCISKYNRSSILELLSYLNMLH